MNIVLFLPRELGGIEKKLWTAIVSSVSGENIEVVRSYKELSNRLTRIPREIAAIVLVASNQNQLSKLYSLKMLLEDLSIILVLPYIED